MRRRGVSFIADPEARLALGFAIAADVVQGKSVPESAEARGFSRATGYRLLRKAKAHGAFEQARTVLTEQAVPLAVRTYLARLREYDLRAAHDVLHGLGLLQKNPAQPASAVNDGGPETIEEYREWRQFRRVTPEPAGQPDE